MMNDQRDTLREVDWQPLCPWLLLVSALRLALGARVLMLASAGLFVSTAGFMGVGQLFSGGATDSPFEPPWAVDSQWPTWETETKSPLTTGTDSEEMPAFGSDTGRLPLSRWFAHNSLVRAWRRLSQPVVQLFDRRLGGVGFVHSLLCGIWAIAVWSLFGGAITRIAALYLTRGERLGMRGALAQTAQRLVSFIAAPLVPLVILGLLSILLMIPGLVATWWWGFAWLMSLLWFVVLSIGFLMAIVAIGLLFGWPLMWATLSVERTDAFDAFSRSYAYVYQRPLRLLFYGLVAIVLGFAGTTVVYAFAFSAVYLSDLAVGWGTIGFGGGPEQMISLSESAGVRFWKGVLAAIVEAFPIGMLWTAGVGVYLLMRRDIDAAEMDEVIVEEQGQAFGLPRTDHLPGVPSVGDSKPADRQEVNAGGDPGESTSDPVT